MGTNVTRSSGKGKNKALLRAGLPRNTGSMSKEVLEATLHKKRECNARAQRIVESLLEKDIREEKLIDCLKFINDTHFQDVVEERAISELCGYPLCGSALMNIPNQQYRISTTLNKVYDITDRKNFCSNQCYKASRYLKDQLLTSPLWLRDKEEIPAFKLLSLGHSGGMVGDEVNFGKHESVRHEEIEIKQNNTKNLEKTSSMTPEVNDPVCEKVTEVMNVITGNSSTDTIKEDSFPTSNYSDLSANKTSEENFEAVKIMCETKFECSSDEMHSDSNSQADFRISPERLPEKESCSEKHKSSIKNEERIRRRVGQDNREKLALNTKLSCRKQSEVPLATVVIEKCLREWFTLDSMYFLFGEGTTKELLADRDITHYYKPADSDSWDPAMRQRYIAICKKLNLIELEDIRYDNKVANENKDLRPLPEHSSIKEEGMKLQLKVRAFYAGQTAYEDISAEDQSQDNEPNGNFLPLVDLHSGSALRRRIVLDHFNRILPDLLSAFGISSRDISDDLRCLVFSFCLSAHNITFKPTEWNLLGLIILKMLSIKDNRIKTVLETEQSRKYITMMLMVFEEDGGYLERLIAWLIDVDYLLWQHSGRKAS